MTDQNNMPEAVASVTYSVMSKGGYNALFTIRGTSGAELLDTMASIEGVLESKGYKPQIKNSFGAKKEVEYVEGKVCPKDGGKLKKIISKKDGKEYWSCANGTFIGGVKGGCDFFTSPANFGLTFDKKNPYSDGNSIPMDQYEASMNKTGHDFDEDFSTIH